MKIDTGRIKYSSDFIIHRLLFALLFAILMVYCSRQIADLDIWLHLKAGEVIARSGSVPLNDIFSFTMAGKPWTNHEWLFQLLAFFSFQSHGPDGLIVMQNIVIIATFLLLLFFGVKKNHPVFVFIVLYLVLLTTAYRFTIRPDIFSLFFLALTLFILKNSEEKKRWLWSLPFIQIIWVNMHGFSFLGPAVIAIELCALGLQKILPRTGFEKEPDLQRRTKQLLVVLVLMVLASGVNPAGIKGAVYPLTVLGQISGEGKIIFSYIQELARPINAANILSLNSFLIYKILILVCLFSFRVNAGCIKLADALLGLFFLVFSLLAVRNVAYFGIAAAFIIFINFASARQRHKYFPRFASKKLNAVALYGLILFLFIFPAKGAMKYLETASFDFKTYQLKSDLWGIAVDRYPDRAVQFLLDHPFPKLMFNDFNSGSYLIGKAFPSRRVFIDGRTELYGPEFFKFYVRVGEGQKEALDELFRRYPIKGFFLTNPHRDLHVGLIRFLHNHPEWQCVYFDETAIIFLRDVPENKDLINRYAVDLNKWEPPDVSFLKIGIAGRYPDPFLRRAHLLSLLRCHEAAWREARLALEILPSNGEAFKFVQDYYFERGQYLEAFKYARLSLIYGGGHPWMRARLALIYHKIDEDDKAQRVVGSVIRHNPKFAQGYYVKALIIKEDNIREATAALRKAVELAPKEPRYARALGDLLEKQGQPEEASRFWKAAYAYDSANQELAEKTARTF